MVVRRPVAGGGLVGRRVAAEARSARGSRPGPRRSGGRRPAWPAAAARRRGRRRAGCAARPPSASRGPSRGAAALADAPGRAGAEHPGHLRAHEVEQELLALAGRRRHQLVADARPTARRRGAGAGRAALASATSDSHGGTAPGANWRRKVGQSIGTTPTCGRPCAISAPSASRPWAGAMVARPLAPDRARSTPWVTTEPTSDHAAPVDAEPRPAVGPAIGGQRVEEAVGGGVVGLAGRAEQRRRRREQDEVVEGAARAVSSWRCGAPSTLGASTVAKRRPVLAHEGAVVEHAGGVDHAAQRRQLRGDGVEGAGHVARVADVGLQHEHLGAGRLAAGRWRADGLGARSAPAEQREVAGALADEPLGHEQAETAQAAGDEVARRPGARASRRPGRPRRRRRGRRARSCRCGGPGPCSGRRRRRRRGRSVWTGSGLELAARPPRPRARAGSGRPAAGRCSMSSASGTECVA